MGTGYLEHLLEVVAARGEDDLVGGDPLVVADEGHIHELVIIAQLAHTVDDVGLVVGPLDAELRTRHGSLKIQDENSLIGFLVRLSACHVSHQTCTNICVYFACNVKKLIMYDVRKKLLSGPVNAFIIEESYNCLSFVISLKSFFDKVK